MFKISIGRGKASLPNSHKPCTEIKSVHLFPHVMLVKDCSGNRALREFITPRSMS